MTPSALELVRRHASGETTAVETVRDALDRVAAARESFGGVAAVDPEWSLAEAAESDRRSRAGRGGVLEGVPVTVKDWIDVAGLPVTGATGDHRGIPGRRPGADASAVARLRAAGAIVVAISSAAAGNALHGPTRNPLDPSRAPGGSSSGTAALVAAGAVPLGLGSDSGGSIRLPAAWCGVAGLKPTFGRVPLTGHFPRCGTLEDGRTVIGPLAGTVRDLGVALRVIAGPDGLDAGMPPVPLGDPPADPLGDPLGDDAAGIAGLRVGTMAGGGTETTLSAIEALAEAGAVLVDEPVPDVRDEALELTRRYWRRGELTGAECVRVLWDWDRFRRRMLTVTAHLDVIVTPAAPGPPPPWRESAESDYLWTLPWSLTGAPATVTPWGTDNGLPGAVQIIARPWEDPTTLTTALQLERARRGDPRGGRPRRP